MTDLDKLIEAVEGGNVRPYVIEELASLVFDFRVYGDIARAYHGSLDAAKALHEALLPGWRWTRHHDGEIEVWATGVLSRRWGRSDDKDPARAWLLAVLKAYRSLQ